MKLSCLPERPLSSPVADQNDGKPERLTHPAINVETGIYLDAPAAYEQSTNPGQLRPDRTMRCVAEFLAAPTIAGAKDRTEELKGFTVCPLTHDTFDNPVVASDGFTYSFSAIKTWWETQAEAKHVVDSPLNRDKIVDFRLIPNTAMRALMADLGMTDCHSPDVDLDAVANWAPRPACSETQMPTRRHLQLDYLRDAPALLAQSDHRLGGLTETLRSSSSSSLLGRVRVALVGVGAQVRIKKLFSATQFAHIHEVAKTFRAVDVQLQLGRVKKAEALLSQALVKAPDNQILLSRMALIEARRGHSHEATQMLAKLFACPVEEVMSILGEHTLNNPAHPPRSIWPLIAVHGFLLEDTTETQESRALLYAAADMFPSRLLNSYRVNG